MFPGEGVLIFHELIGREIAVVPEGLAQVGLCSGNGLHLSFISGEFAFHFLYRGIEIVVAVGEISIDTKLVLEEFGLCGERGLELSLEVGPVAVSVEEIADRIYCGVGHGAVRVPDRRARVAFVRDVSPDVSVAFRVGLRHDVFGPGDVGVVGNLQPRRDLVSHLHAAVQDLVGFRVSL